MSQHAKTFVVINCLSHGFAVAGPPEPKDREAGVDLEMIQWGMTPEAAKVLADDLNAEPKLQHRTD